MPSRLTIDTSPPSSPRSPCKSPLRNMLNHKFREPCPNKDQVIADLCVRLCRYLHVWENKVISLKDRSPTPIALSNNALKALACLIEENPHILSFEGTFEKDVVRSSLDLLEKDLYDLLAVDPAGEATSEEKDFFHSVYKTALVKKINQTAQMVKKKNSLFSPPSSEVKEEKVLVLAPSHETHLTKYSRKKLIEALKEDSSIERLHLGENIVGSIEDGFELAYALPTSARPKTPSDKPLKSTLKEQ